MRREELEELVRPLLQENGLELVQISVARGGRIQNIRITLDHPAGLSVESCGRVSRRLAVLLDANPLLRTAYSLEVSSAGMNRPIWTADHFRRFFGEKVRISLRESAPSPHYLTGVIGPEDGDGFWVELGEDRFEGSKPARSAKAKKSESGKRGPTSRFDTRNGVDARNGADAGIADAAGEAGDPGRAGAPAGIVPAGVNAAASASEAATANGMPHRGSGRRLVRMTEIAAAELSLDPWKRRELSEPK